MSTGRLILSFRNGVSLSLNKEKLETGAVIKIDSDLTQAGLQYQEADWTRVDHDEVHDVVVARLSGTGQQATNKKRKKNNATTVEANKKMKSMVTTADGRLVSAVPTEVQGERRATLTATQRRNKNRRIHKMLNKLVADQNKESTSTALTTSTSKKPVQKKPEEKVTVLKSPELESLRPYEP